jgi:hypothetical protein
MKSNEAENLEGAYGTGRMDGLVDFTRYWLEFAVVGGDFH